MSSLVEIHGSACEGLRFRTGRTAIETIVEILVRHLPQGVFREKDFNKYDYFSKRAKNCPRLYPSHIKGTLKPLIFP
jgi:hypothetical protein